MVQVVSMTGRGLALSIVLLLPLCLTAGSRTNPAERPSSVVLIQRVPGTTLGVTHTQYSLDSWEDPQRRSGGERVLSGANMPQNQHIMGWGVGNPEPSPGGYDWSRLDERMELIKYTGGTPVITLCCAPDWMKGGRAGETDWSRLTDAPLREHYDDFARLAAQVARRYPEVRHFQVWNELKGFWNVRANRWDYESFTDFYNAVYDAVRTARPDALIGGPYITLDTWSTPPVPSTLRGPWGVVDRRALDALDYWMEHKHGANFVTIDAGTSTRDCGLITNAFAANELFAVVTRWATERTGLPVWWSEFYPEPSTSNSPLWTSSILDAVARAAGAGAGSMLLWQPQSSPGQRSGALWTTAWGAQATPLAKPWIWLARTLPRGETTILRTVDGTVLVFDSPEGALLVNLTASKRQVEVMGVEIALPPYGSVIKRS